MGYTEMSLEEALKIQRKERPYNMLDLRGAIRALQDNLGFKDAKLVLPKGETAQSWMDRLAACIKSDSQNSVTIEQLRGL